MVNFTVKQHDDLAKSTGKRMHLNLLLHDHSEENLRTYGASMPRSGSLIKPIRGTQAHSDFAGKAMSTSTTDKAAARQLAAQVNNKRTPTGQFFTTINPTMYEKQAPPATYDGYNVTKQAVSTMRGGATGIFDANNTTSSTGLDPQTSGLPLYLTAAAESSSTGSMDSTQSSTAAASWLLPWQTGDRKLGRAMAEAVRHKRTPNGSFANRDLTKAAK